MKKQILIISCALLATGLHAAQAPREWGPEQATGAPNTPTAGDLPTAWASLHPDGGTEWLQVEFDKPVEVAEVLIRETFNPGAISKVVAIETDNKESTIWEGQAPASAAPTEMVVKASSPVSSNKIKIYLDSNRVPGWNEIDAVQLVGKDGSRQWASTATASSSFAERPNTAQPVAAMQPQIPAQQFNLQELLGNSLVNAQGKPVDPSTLKGKTIGLYFSAHWCGPCKAFTPKLVEFRNKIAKDFEVVFISSDRDETGMFNYMKESGMPWPALPFNSEKKGELNKLFQVRGIPSLIILNDKGLRIAGNPINDVVALAPVAAFEKWKQNIVERSIIIPNSCSIQNPIRRIYEGEKVTPPKDLTIDPGKSIFGCTYGSTEKEVIDRLGQPIGKVGKGDKSFSLIYGNDTELVFNEGGLCGARLQEGFDYLDSNDLMSFSIPDLNQDGKYKTGGWRLSNGVHFGMESNEAKKIPSVKTNGWYDIEYTQNNQLIKISCYQRQATPNGPITEYIHGVTVMPADYSEYIKNVYVNPFNIPSNPSESLFGCRLGSNRDDIEKQLGKPMGEFWLGKNKEGLLYNQSRYLLILRDGKLEGGRFKSGDYHNPQNRQTHEIFLPFKERIDKNSSEILPFTLNNGVGLLQPLAYAKGILGDKLKGETYTDGPSLVILRSARFHKDSNDNAPFEITRSLITEIIIQPIDISKNNNK